MRAVIFVITGRFSLSMRWITSKIVLCK